MHGSHPISPDETSSQKHHITADEEDQLMSLDASGKPVVVARPASAKAGSSLPSRIKTSSSTSHSMPGSKPKGSASGNRSTAGSQRPGSAKPSKGRLAPLSIPTGSKATQSMLVCSGGVPAFRRFGSDDLNALKQPGICM